MYEVPPVYSHRSSQPFLPVTTENIRLLANTSTYQYFNKADLLSLGLEFVEDEELLMADPQMDVDKFFVKVPTTLISRLSIGYTTKSYFVDMNCAFADNYTLQLVTDPFCLSVPINPHLKIQIIDCLSEVGDVTCYPSKDPRVLSARQFVLDSAVLQASLLAAGVTSVFLSSYGGKLSFNRFQETIGAHVEPWSAGYITDLINIIYVPKSQRDTSSDPVVLNMNNTYDIGKTYHTVNDSIIVFNAIGQRRNNQWRNMYHLLGALTNNPEHPELTYGGLRFTHKTNERPGLYAEPQDRILRRTIYLVSLRIGSLGRIVYHIYKILLQ
jgi:hypothetical protein